MTNDRLITLLYNTIICLEEFGIKGEELEFEIGISEDEYKKVMEETEAKQICKDYFNGDSGTELHISEITDETPCGNYWFEG